MDAWDEDWSRLWWCRLDGTAEIVADGVALLRAQTLLTARYPQYAERPPQGPAIVISVTAAQGWRA